MPDEIKVSIRTEASVREVSDYVDGLTQLIDREQQAGKATDELRVPAVEVGTGDGLLQAWQVEGG